MEHIKGHTGLLSMYDTAAYKPIMCLTSTSMERAAEMTEKITYCTQGEKQSSVTSITRSLNFDGEYVADDAGATYEDLVSKMESMTEQDFKLEGRGEPIYFKAVIASLSDSFPAEGDATFSGTLNINGEPTTVDPFGI